MARTLQLAAKGAAIRVTKLFDLAVTAVTNTDFIFPVPVGAQDLILKSITTTGFTAVTDAQISIGSSAAGAQYVAATTIKAIGRKAHTLVDTAASDYLSFPASGLFYVRIAQSGGNTAVGAAKLVVEYSLPTR
jgi:hypothetical protein